MLRRSYFALSSRKRGVVGQVSILSTALNVLADAPKHQQKQKNQIYGLAATETSNTPWIDRDEERAIALTEHRHSEVYQELHRRPTTHTELGLYGGEPGFNTGPRVWVDPDNPHIRHLWNCTPLAVNSRWARYGHFKGDLHIIDVDKLCRHARNVPPIDKLLIDLSSNRVALDDDGCSALIRHGARSLANLASTPHYFGKAEHYFNRIQETFERFLVSINPPMYAGVRTHADMIRCCSLMKNKWEEGFNQYRLRAVEEAQDAKLRRAQMMRTTSSNSSSRKKKLSSSALNDAADDRSLIEVGNEYSKDALIHDPAFSAFGDSTTDMIPSETQNNNSNNEDELLPTTPTTISDQVAFRAHNTHLFELDSEFYDAVIELCIVHEKYEECIEQLYELIESRHRPRVNSLTNALVAATYLKDTTIGDEIPKLVELYKLRPTVQYYEALAAYSAMVRPGRAWSTLLEAFSTPIADTGNILKSGVAGSRSAAEVFRSHSFTDVHLSARGDDHNANSYNPADGNRAQGSSDLVCDRDASYDPNRFDGRNRVVRPTGRTVSWSILGLANNDNCTNANEVFKMLDLASSKGIALDYEPFTFALYFAAQKATLGLIDGESLYAYLDELVNVRIQTAKVNMTPEMILFAVRALARLPIDNSNSKNNNLLLSNAASLALEIISSAVDVSSSSTRIQGLSNNRSSAHLIPAFFELYQALARAGAMATFSSTMRNYVLSRGETVESWLLRSWLWCNSNATTPNGSHHTTSEAVEFLMMNRHHNETTIQSDHNMIVSGINGGDPTSSLTREMVIVLALCRMKHGEISKEKFPKLVQTLNSIVLDDSSDNNDDESAGAGEEITLFDMVEYYADMLSNIVKTGGNDLLQNKMMMNNTKKEKNILSLEESLGSILDGDDQQSSSNDEFDLQIKNYKEFISSLLVHHQQNLSSASLPPSSTRMKSSISCNEYNSCSLLVDGILKLAQAQQEKLESSSSSGDDSIQKEKMMMNIGYSMVLSGLPSEKESSDTARKFTAEEDFHPTPTDLRELHAKWSMDVYDTALRRQGQMPPKTPKVRAILPHAMQVQPFHENLQQ